MILGVEVRNVHTASENPEITEIDDKPPTELREIMNWATGSFVRNPEGFIARYKRPYGESMGRTPADD
ncbi:hypothetical protein V1505DRAFT_394253 [Lipomyces doorenjongii]